MTQLMVRIAPILLICIAATPVGAGPRGGALFGGGVHFGAGGGAFAAPHIAAPQAGTGRIRRPRGPQIAKIAKPTVETSG